MKVWHAADRYASNGLSLITWLATIARNTAIDHHRAKARRREDATEILPEQTDRSASPEDMAVAKGELGRINECMAELDRARQMAVKGAYLNGLSYAELAEAANVPINTMRTWLRRSLIALRECMAR